MIQYEGKKEYTPQELLNLIERIKAIVYARVSTGDQVKNYSIESQIKLCVDKAKREMGYQENEILVVIEPGESGDDPNRPALNHVLDMIENGVGRKVFMLHPNRMSRDLYLQTMVSRRVWERGCDLVFVEFDVDPDNPESMLMYNIQGSIAQYNKAKILADTDRGRKTMLNKNKIPGIRRIYGYSFHKELDTLVENPEEKDVYLRMVSWIRFGKEGQEMSCTRVAEELSLLGVPGPDGGIWYQSTVSRILRNPVYLGTYFYGKTKIEKKRGQKRQVAQPKNKWYSISVPRYIDEEAYEDVQRKLNDNVKKGRGAKTDHYLLKGLVRCGRCGAAVGAAPLKRSQSVTYYYYGCTRKTKKGFKVGTGEPNQVCRGRNWRQDVVDEQVWNYLLDRLQDPDRIIAEVVKQQQDVKQIEELHQKQSTHEKRLKENNDERKNFLQLFAKGRIRSEEELDELLASVDQRIDHLEHELTMVKEALRNASMTIDELEIVKQSIEEFRKIIYHNDFNFKAKKMLVERFVSKVILGENTIEIITRWHPISQSIEQRRPSGYG
ncbi:recombinase family protein [Tumebacillus lipolyticus]|uniref:Recombinase family protein n=1 Tax=Tumebacillus lipolyticus TaxID=1280370 RepID=A0ABW4ZS19_9BACL